MVGIPAFTTKKDFVIESIREQILSGEIRPGEQLLQRELAERFNTSVTPVREALLQLEKEDIVESSPHRGARVVSISGEDALEICVIRARLEEMALERAASKMKPEHLERLWDIQGRMEIALKNRQPSTVRTLNREFHQTLIDLADSPRLSEVITYVWNRLPWSVLPAKYEGAERIIHSHRDVLEAVEVGDIGAAKKNLGQHIILWGQFLERYLADAKLEIGE